MNTHSPALFFSRIEPYELGFCRLLNRAIGRRGVRPLFASISRLGDGVFWYMLMALLPVIHGRAALDVSLRMAAVGAVGVLIYPRLKTRRVRTRPFEAHAGILAGAAPLDKYSFPSGHTLPAVGFTVVATAYYPQLAWLLAPFALLVALSRIILGLHWPTDVPANGRTGRRTYWPVRSSRRCWPAPVVRCDRW